MSLYIYRDQGRKKQLSSRNTSMANLESLYLFQRSRIKRRYKWNHEVSSTTGELKLSYLFKIENKRRLSHELRWILLLIFTSYDTFCCFFYQLLHGLDAQSSLSLNLTPADISVIRRLRKHFIHQRLFSRSVKARLASSLTLTGIKCTSNAIL